MSQLSPSRVKGGLCAQLRAKLRRQAHGSLQLGALLLWGCAHAPTPEDPAVASPPSANVDRLLRAPAEKAAKAGAKPITLLARGAHIPGDSLGGFVLLAPQECLLALGRGNAGVADLDLFAFSDSGEELGRDEAPDETPALVFCTDQELRAYVAARVVQGSGLVSLGVARVPRSRLDAVRNALGLNRPGEPSPETWPGLETALQEHRETLGGRWRDSRRVAVPIDSRLPTNVSTTVPAQACVDLLVLTDGEARELDIEILDVEGRLVGRAQSMGSQRTALLCGSEAPADVTFVMRPHSGQGTAVVLISSTASAAERQQLHPEVHPIEIGAPSAQRSPPAALAPGAALEEKRLELEVGELNLTSVVVSGCARLDLIPLAPLVGYALSAHDPQGGLVGRQRANTSAPLFLCARGETAPSPPTGSAAAAGGASSAPDESGGHESPRSLEDEMRSELRDKSIRRSAAPASAYRLTLEATRRAGPLVLRQLTDRDAPPGLYQHPLAASRLLGLAASLDLLETPSQLGRVLEQQLVLDRLTRLSFSVPAQHCLSLLVALDEGGRGLSLTAIDSATGLVLDHRTAHEAGSVRACGPAGGSRALVFEISTTDAAGPALLATRQVPLDQPLAPPASPAPTQAESD